MNKQVEQIIFEWVDLWVIGEHFCPFAKPVRVKNGIHLTLSNAVDIGQMQAVIKQECEALTNKPTRATTLVAFTGGGADFFTFLDWLDAANQTLEDEGWSGTYQLASFHPDYLFADEAADSPTHYTNRAPLPVLHILREADITQVMPSQNEADVIVKRNQFRCNELGTDFFIQQFRDWQSRLNQVLE